MIKAVVFDLDYTLHDDNKYWFGAFRDISEYLKKKSDICKLKTFKILKHIFEKKTSNYKYLFNDLLKELSFNNPEIQDRLIKEFVEIYWNHKPKLKPYDEVPVVLNELKKTYKLGLITNGRYLTQLRKLDSLNLKRFFDEIICPEVSERKPNQKPYFEIAKKLGIRLDEMVYVGDNPIVDFSGIKDSDITTVRILRGQFKDVKVSDTIDAYHKVKDLLELNLLLKKLNKVKK